MKKLIFLMSLIVLSGCSVISELSPELPSLVIGVAPVTQPASHLELMAGYFPEPRALAEEEDLKKIEGVLKETLDKTSRQYTYLPLYSEEELIKAIGENSTKGILAYWTAFGQKGEAELLLVPQVYYYEGASGATNPMGLMLDFYLIDLREKGVLLKRSHYAEQETIEENMPSFVMGKKGRTIDDFILEAINLMILELGL